MDRLDSREGVRDSGRPWQLSQRKREKEVGNQGGEMLFGSLCRCPVGTNVKLSFSEEKSACLGAVWYNGYEEGF